MMKVGDEIGLPVYVDEPTGMVSVCDSEGYPICTMVDSKAAAAALAINCHDELVEALSDTVTEMQCLIGAHTQMIGGLDDDSPALVAYNKAKIALEKAK